MTMTFELPVAMAQEKNSGTSAQTLVYGSEKSSEVSSEKTQFVLHHKVARPRGETDIMKFEDTYGRG
jgi:hypothetical protein